MAASAKNMSNLQIIKVLINEGKMQTELNNEYRFLILAFNH